MWGTAALRLVAILLVVLLPLLTVALVRLCKRPLRGEIGNGVMEIAISLALFALVYLLYR